MKKTELLVPVGNLETLKYAVFNGADAVYLGYKKFNARMYSNNFTEDELINAVKFCHLYGVKIYITMNTIIFDSETDEFIDTVKFLYEAGVDALIMQDIGMISLVRKIFPNLEIHASTQVHTSNSNTVKYLEKIGVKRVVFARELSLNEINSIDTPLEKEVFIHGALCVSYSGCCLFSAMNGKRSANRGECVASCRLPYKLLENNKEIKTNGDYLLSMKELNSIHDIKDILDSNIDSLKIEGRMKSKEYIGYITSLYRKIIDNYYDKKDLIITDEEIINLKKLFNREFTKGFINNELNNDIVNIKSPNHVGYPLGKVIDINKKYIKIKIDDDLYQEDGIRFVNSNKGFIVNKLYNDKKLLVNKVLKNNICYIDNKINLKTYDLVSKTIDKNLLNKINNLEEKKIKVSFKVEAKLNKHLTITITDGVNSIKKIGNIIEEAKNMPTTEERIISQIKKLGNTPFITSSINIDMDNNIFIQVKEINVLRREVVNELKEMREKTKKEVIINEYKNTSKEKEINNININILVRNEEQLRVALEEKLNNIYVTDFKLYKKYKHLNNIFYRTSRIINNLDFDKEKLLITNLGALSKYSKNNEVVTDYYLNVVNKYSYHLLKENSNIVCLSPEFIPNNYKKYYNAEVILIGRIELMVMKYCPLKYLVNKEKTCKVCRSNNKYYLKDKNNNLYPIVNNKELTHIMHYKNINLLDNIDKYVNLGIKNYRIELFDENSKDTKKIIEQVKEKLWI